MSDAKDPVAEAKAKAEADANAHALAVAIAYESETDAFARARLRQAGSDVLEKGRALLHPTPAAEAPPAEVPNPERDAAAAQAWAAYTAAKPGFSRARILAHAGSELLQRGQELAGK